MRVLHEIEAKFGFKYPAIYHQMEADGMLSYGARGPDWESKVLPLLLTNPPLLFFAKDFELILPALAIEMRDEFYVPVSYRTVPPGTDIVPFGATGGGDLYCFDIAAAKDGDLPVVLAAHDSSRIETLAKNFQEFVYLSLLDMVTDVEPDDAVMHGEFEVNVQNMMKTHARYLTDAQCLELKNAG